MKIYISFCNVTSGVYLEKNIAVVNLETDSISYMHSGSISMTGLLIYNNQLYAATQVSLVADPVDLYVYDLQTQACVSKYKLHGVRDVHSILVNENSLCVVSTGNEKIVSFQLPLVEDNFISETVYMPTNDNTDTVHMNSIAMFSNTPHVTMFGARVGDRWSSSRNGSIVNLDTKETLIEGLHHPHSFVSQKNDWYVCESSLKRVLKNGTPIIIFDEGYVRGLAVNDEYIIVGLSSGRKNSKSLGIINNSFESGEPISICRVLVYKAGEYVKPYKTFDFTGDFPEIYDIMLSSE
jgi:hypothetical protein